MKKDVEMNRTISHEYIRGLIEGEGCFTFCTSNNNGKKYKIPTFAIGMTRRDRDLLIKVRDSLSLNNRVYEYGPRSRKDGYKRDGMAMLLVRDVGQLKNIIVPLFYKKLLGNKGLQFESWIKKIGSDPTIPERYKIIPKICSGGFYDKNYKNND